MADEFFSAIDRITLSDFYDVGVNWDEVEIQAKSLPPSNRKVALCIDEEGTSSRILDDAMETLERTGIALVKVKFSTLWWDQSRSIGLLQKLISLGLTPIFRDQELGDSQCNVIFARTDVTRELWPTPSYDRQGGVPVLIPCFNNPTYCALMLDQLWDTGFEDIRFVDNASTSAQMHDWLRREDSRRKVIKLTENMGPNKSINRLKRELPRHFCVTDPDVLFNARLPTNFLTELLNLTKRHAVGKAGFALDISRSHLFTGKALVDRDDTIPRWEEQFWSKPLHFTDGGDRVFEARIDTTFCVIDQKYYRPSKPYDAVRVAGRYTATHLPWEGRTQVPVEEKEVYARTQLHSNYGN
ncbi:glycosyltransferase family A protein [Mesorhizobium sp. RIZ17]|uniref:glycosyltransferase family A protein n=1 Tax=Mesorhizobium sp. RIZ17 TaxID=3132743 RepID=UPI003DA87A60